MPDLSFEDTLIKIKIIVSNLQGDTGGCGPGLGWLELPIKRRGFDTATSRVWQAHMISIGNEADQLLKDSTSNFGQMGPGWTKYLKSVRVPFQNGQ